MIVPTLWADLGSDWKAVGAFFVSIPKGLYALCTNILKIPNRIM